MIRLKSIILSAAMSAVPIGALATVPDCEGDAYSEAYYGHDFDALKSLVAQGKKSGDARGWYYDGRLAMLDYDFPRATKSFAEYAKIVKRTPSKAVCGAGNYNSELAEAKQQFERFQDVVVIDAVKVPRQDFFKYLRLPLSAGRVVADSEFLNRTERLNGPIYINESSDHFIWSEFATPENPDPAKNVSGQFTIAEADMLTNGTLSDVKIAREIGAENPAYPFLSADGTTLYFSAEGPNSMGGRDIFITTRDPQTGEYRTPVNAGMPFNSPADDYMMVLDEENGVGWWATDRKSLPDDEIMLYVYVLPEGRKNFEGTTEEKKARALLDDYRVTWVAEESEESEESEDSDISDNSEELLNGEAIAKKYESLAEEIRKIQPGQKPRKEECRIPVKGGKFIYSADDVKGRQQKQLVNEYIAAEKAYETDREKLDKMRRQYANKATVALKQGIQQMEESVAQQQKKIQLILSNLYKTM